jgi:hypothetical protein
MGSTIQASLTKQRQHARFISHPLFISLGALKLRVFLGGGAIELNE